jgi:hypothetical protein
MFKLQISGERPTRAGPNPCAEASIGSAAGDWPWGGTRADSRGPVTKWSNRGGLARYRLVAYPLGAPVPARRGAWLPFWKSSSRCSWVGSTAMVRVYRYSASKKATDAHHGNPHAVQPIPPRGLARKRAGISGAKSRPGGGGAMGFFAFFGGLSISQLNPGPWPARVESPESGVKPVMRRVTVVEDR